MISRWNNPNLFPYGVPRFAGSRPGTSGVPDWLPCWLPDRAPQNDSQMGHPRLASNLKEAPHIGSKKKAAPDWLQDWEPRLALRWWFPRLVPKWGYHRLVP